MPKVAWYQPPFFKINSLIVCNFLERRFNGEWNYIDPEPEGPYILLSNHANFFDPWFLGRKTDECICYMGNEDGMKGLSGVYTSIIGTFPKAKGERDSRSIRHMVKLVKANRTIGIFPEGDRSWDGRTDHLFTNTVRLVKKFKIPLRVVKATGNYLSGPRWAEEKRRGKIFYENRVLEPDEYLAMSDEELFKKLTDMLANNDFKDERLKNIPFKCKNPAHGIQHLLWLSPEGHEDSLYGKGDQIICQQSGKRWHIDSNQNIEDFPYGKNTQEWFDWQNAELQKRIKKASRDEVLLTSDNFDAFAGKSSHKKDFMAKGQLVLFKDRIRFSSNGSTVFEKQINEISSCSDYFNRHFDIAFGGENIRFLAHGANVNKYIYALRMLGYLKV